MDSSSNRWLVRDTQGSIAGPYSTEVLIRQIERGRWQGGEEVCLYPGGNWMPIAQKGEFYDALLEAISNDSDGTSFDDEEETTVSGWALPEDISKISPPFLEAPKAGQSPVAGQPPLAGSPDQSSSTDSSDPWHGPVGKKTSSHSSSKQHKKLEIIDLESQGTLRKRFHVKTLLVGGVITIAFVLIYGLFKHEDAQGSFKDISLTPIAYEQNTSLTPEESKGMREKAWIYFLRSTYNNQKKSNRILAELLRSSFATDTDFSLLCMNYFEIWSLTKQTSLDHKVLRQAVNYAFKKFPMGHGVKLCKVVKMFSMGDYEGANKQVNALILSAQVPRTEITFSNYLKANVVRMKEDFLTAQDYLSSVEKAMPKWSSVYLQLGIVAEQQRDFSKASGYYIKLLELYSQNKGAFLHLGIAYYYARKDSEEVKAFITQGLAIEDVVSQGLEALARTVVAQVYEREGHLKQALEWAHSAYEVYPSKKHNAAFKIIQKHDGEQSVDSIGVDDITKIYEGDFYSRSGNCVEAIAHYKTAYRVNSKNAVAPYKAARCFWTLGLRGDALKWLGKAINSDSKFLEAYILMARYKAELYDFSDAARFLSIAYRVSPKSDLVQKGFAVVEYQRRNYKAARDFAFKALSLNSIDKDTHQIYARSLMKLGKTSEAFVSVTRAIELHNTDIEVQCTYAEIMSSVQGVSSGVEYLKRKLDESPNTFEYYVAIGDILTHDEQYSEAEQYYRKAILFDNSSISPYLGLAKVYTWEGKYEQAVGVLLKASLKNPSEVKPLFEKGRIFLQQKKYKLAIRDFSRVKTINTHYPLVDYYLGYTYFLLGNHVMALEFMKKEKKKNPNLSEPYELAAKVYSAQGKFSLCAQEYQYAMRYRVHSAKAYVQLAACYRLDGQKDLARSMLIKAESLESGLPELYREYGYLFESEGKVVKALEAFNRYLTLAPQARDTAKIRSLIQSLQRQ